MSTAEDIRADGKREDYKTKMERMMPEPCGCQWLSECCGAAPVGAFSDPTLMADAPVGTCSRCLDSIGFEKSDEKTWEFRGKDVYGDDADGNRGVPMTLWECSACGDEVEVLG